MRTEPMSNEEFKRGMFALCRRDQSGKHHLGDKINARILSESYSRADDLARLDCSVMLDNDLTNTEKQCTQSI